MSKYSVDINVSSRTAQAGAARSAAGSRENIRLGSQKASEIRKDMKKKRGPEVQSNQALSREIGKLSKTLTKLEASINKLAGSAGSGRGPGAAAPGGRRPPGRGGSGAGIGRMGAALPIAGAVIGAFGFALSKVTEIGRAYIQKTMQQYGTAGVGGFQKSGRFLGTFGAAEYGAYEKEKRMAAGRFDLGTEEYPSYLEKATARGALKKRTPEPIGTQIGSIFGTTQQMGKMAGLSRAMLPQQKSGEAFVGNIVKQIVQGQRGLTTELPFIIGEVTRNMEEAVREGVSSSTMAGDMAKELSVMGRGTLTGQARSAARTQKDLIDIQTQVGRNQGAGAGQWQMRVAARDLIQGTGKSSQEAQKYLMGAGIISQTDLDRGLTPAQMRTSVQFLNQSKSQAVREKYIERVVPTFAGEGSQSERFTRFHKIAQDAGISRDVTQSMDIFKKYERKDAPKRLQNLLEKQQTLEQESRTEESRLKSVGGFGKFIEGVTSPFRRNKDDINKDLSKVNRDLKDTSNLSVSRLAREQAIGSIGPGGMGSLIKDLYSQTGFDVPRGQKRMETGREAILMGEVGQKAAETVNTVDRAFMKLAKDMAGPVSKNIGLLTTGVKELGKVAGSAMATIGDVAKGLTKMQEDIKKEGSFTEYMGQRLKEAIFD